MLRGSAGGRRADSGQLSPGGSGPLPSSRWANHRVPVSWPRRGHTGLGSKQESSEGSGPPGVARLRPPSHHLAPLSTAAAHVEGLPSACLSAPGLPSCPRGLSPAGLLYSPCLPAQHSASLADREGGRLGAPVLEGGRVALLGVGFPGALVLRLHTLSSKMLLFHVLGHL